MRVDLDHVGHRYADGPLLFHDLTASLMPGHVYALTGPSGAGKSTLLGIIAGWTTPAEGQVTRQGIDSMRWIFQNPHGGGPTHRDRPRQPAPCSPRGSRAARPRNRRARSWTGST